MAKEKWKKLKEDSNYLISTWGRIYSIKGKLFMKPYIHKSRDNKYLRVCLRGKKYMVHVLVAYNFQRKSFEKLKLEYPEANIQVGHNDRNTLNCNNSNLTFETELQNKQHQHATQWVYWGKNKWKGKCQRIEHYE